MSLENFRNRVKKSGAELVSAAKDTKTLADVLSHQMKKEGRPDELADVQKALETKQALFETKANEIMHTANAGFGAELVPGNILMTDFLDLVPKVNPILSQFTGFHGKGMDMKMDVPVIGELPLHQLMPEQTTGALAFAQGLGKAPTAKVEIVQKERYFSVDISEYESRFSVVDLSAIIKRRLAESAANTQISDAVNGDTATGANTNVNLIDGTPAGTESYLGADGLRKKALASAATSFDAGTLAFADFLSLVSALGENAADADALVWLFGTSSHVSALALDEFKNAYINGVASSALTGNVPAFLGASVVKTRWLQKSNAVGKISATPANNTKGTVLLAHRAALQYGYNGDYAIEVYRVPGKGYQLIGYYFSGHAIASSIAGSDPTVAALYNIS